MDQSFWAQIHENNYEVPEEHSLDTLSTELLGYLASSDPALRLGTAYPILEQWIREKNLFTDAQLREMIDKLTENLQKGLGKSDEDSIFLRSTSLWILAFIIQRDAQVSFLDQSQYNDILDQIIVYAQKEQDLRGWVDDKGWAHTTAHIASLLAAIAEHPYANRENDEKILSLIAEHTTRLTKYVYQYGEDDRMAHTVSIILQANRVEVSFLKAWIAQLESVMDLASEGMPFDIQVFHAYSNTRSFVRALYYPIELCMEEKPAVWEDFRPLLLGAIKEIGLC